MLIFKLVNMKINVVKTLIVLGISTLMGLLCFEIAKEDDYRNWLSFIIATISIFLCLGSATACDYNCGHRVVNIKTVAWTFSIIIIISNIVVSFFLYNIIFFVTIMLLITLINIAIVYSLYNSSKKNG